MTRISYRLWTSVSLLLLGATLARADVPEGVEVQARGPIHEAFATPVEGTPAPGRIVDREPPPPIDEQPPDQRPDGDNVVWIPGYFAFDDARDDFLWISGFWRVPPPGRTWMPGSWRRVTNGWQWVAGVWVVEDQPEQQYLPPPPATLETGPSVPAPSSDYMYVPGSWVYTTRYVWRPGCWVAYRPGWVWIPAHFRWTPCGYVFVEGYWDFPLGARGLLFAPVYVDRRVCYRPRWFYRPTYVVYDSCLYGAMFVRTGCSHYYFGDYFDVRYTRFGYRSWFNASFGVGFNYDPLFFYYRHHHRSDPYWAPALRDVYAARYAGDLARPPVRVVNNTTIINNNTTIINNPTIVNKYTNINKSTNIVNVTNVTNNNVVTNIRNFNNVQVNNNSNTTNVVKLRQVSADQQQQFAVAGKKVQEAAVERSKLETQLVKQGGIPATPTDAPKTLKVNLPKTTVTASATSKAPAPPPPAVVTKPKDTSSGSGAGSKTPKIDPKSKVDPMPKIDPKPKVDPMPKIDPKSKIEPKSKVDPKPKIEPTPKIDPKSKVDPKPKIEPTPKIEPKSKVDPKPKIEPTPKIEPKSKVDPKPKIEPTPKIDLRPEIDPKPKIDPKPPVTVGGVTPPPKPLVGGGGTTAPASGGSVSPKPPVTGGSSTLPSKPDSGKDDKKPKKK